MRLDLKIFMIIPKVFSFFFICLLADCGSSVSQTENANQTQPKEKTELSLKMERSHCYGTCPVYELNVQPDGKVTFNGVDFTETKGKAENNLSNEKMEQLVTEIENANFFSYKDLYTKDSGNCPATATDSPTVKLSVNLSGKEKTITHYLGCSEKYEPMKNNSANIRVIKDWSKQILPQQLYNLENKIDEIVGTKRWIGEGKY